jgi:arylsulfatase A-like enzyme
MRPDVVAALLSVFALVGPAIMAATSEPSSNDELPNIVIMLADNLGYDDISLFRSSSLSSSSQRPGTKTPNLDKLGEGGMQFLNWNSVASLCSASRATLLTGKYPVRTGVYPRVFKPDAKYGLLPNETTIAELLRVEGYATSIVGKWHLGHRKPFLPTNQGFDEWIGIPYHMSGGSVDGHVCNSDQEETMWLPLYHNHTIAQQPVNVDTLAETYANSAVRFIQRNTQSNHEEQQQQARGRRPFFLYMAFSHVHQLCAPRDFPEQATCQWASARNASFETAVEEMDWIVGRILDALDEVGVSNNTLVLFTSDNGPWVAEQACSGSKGPFRGDWLKRHVDDRCTACPHDYVPSPSVDRPRRCVLPETQFDLEGVHCGEDTGLGSVWEANMRMPALARFPGRIPIKSRSTELVSTMDVLPTILSMINRQIPDDLDGIDVSDAFYGRSLDETASARMLFYWRDGFQEGPLPVPYGRFDVAAVRYGNFKVWFSTKSAHYNDDVEQFHDPPLLFNVMDDPAESTPLDPLKYHHIIETIIDGTSQHKATVDWMLPLALATDKQYIPCVDRDHGCRTHPDSTQTVDVV